MSIPDPVTIAVTGGLVLSGANQIAKQAQDFLAAATGHPAESIGTIFGNFTRRRLDNLEGILGNAGLTLLSIGASPREVPLNILQPILEAASLQEDDFLRDTWTALLANAADASQTSPILPSFSVILRELTSADVKFINSLVNEAEERSRHASISPPLPSWEFDRWKLQSALDAAGLGQTEAEHIADEYPGVQWRDDESINTAVCMDVLIRNGLIKRNYFSDSSSEQPFGNVASNSVSLTDLAVRFVRACRAPTPSI